LIALYNQFQLDRNTDLLLTQINYHLSQQPGEADAIHDLLAHLAEQMIELNRQKQSKYLTTFKNAINAMRSVD
jgi:hypothetical protein